MSWLVDNIKWIMLVSGVLTCTMIFAVVNPRAALRQQFGESLEGPVAEIIVRNWGALIALVGAMLVYGAYDPPGRRFILIIAGASKLIFIALVLSHGNRYLRFRAGVSVMADLVMVALYGGYLMASAAP